MGAPDHSDASGGGASAAEEHLKKAKAELGHAVADFSKAGAELHDAEAEIAVAEAELEEAKHHEIDVKVDGKLKRVRAGTYRVSAFKALVGVSADYELDIVERDVFKPLDDNADITLHECEIFVSHPRTGGSS